MNSEYQTPHPDPHEKVDPDEIPQNAKSHQDLKCLPLYPFIFVCKKKKNEKWGKEWTKLFDSQIFKQYHECQAFS